MGRREVDELEVIDVDADGGPAGRLDQPAATAQAAWWTRRRVVVALALVAALAASLLTARAVHERRAVDSLDEAVLVAHDLEAQSLDRVEALMETRPVAGDRTFLGAVTDLARAHADHLRSLRSGLPWALPLDRPTRAARDAVQAYLSARIDLLDTLAEKGPAADRALVPTDAVEQLLRAADEAVAGAGPGDRSLPRDARPRLPRLEGEIDRLQRPSDEPLGIDLVSVGSAGYRRLDLDRGGSAGPQLRDWAEPVRSGESLGWLDPRRERLVPDPDHVGDAVPGFSTGGEALGITMVHPARLATIRGEQRGEIPDAVALVASVHPGRFWVQHVAEGGGWVVREVTERGHTTAGPHRSPANHMLFGAAPEGLVLSGRDQVLWDPASGARQVLAKGGYPLSLGGSTFVWRDDESDAVRVSVIGAEGSTRLGTHHVLLGDASPDGTHVAAIEVVGDVDRWVIFEVATGDVHRLGVQASGGALWSPDGKHALLRASVDRYLARGIVAPAPTLVRWTVGQPGSHPLRMPAGWEGPAVAVAGDG